MEGVWLTERNPGNSIPGRLHDTQHLSGLLPGGNGAFVLVAQFDRALHQGGIGRCQSFTVESNVIFQARSGVATGSDGPLIDGQLAGADAGGPPMWLRSNASTSGVTW